MAYTTINKHTAFFNTVTYTGNGGTNAITGVGHQPDFTWLKRRDGSGNHNLYDAVRGVTKYLESSANSPDQTQSAGLTAFGTDGFTLGSNANMNGNSDTFVSWNWKANGAGSSNSDGSVTSTVSANTTAGFSIAKYTGTGSNLTFGHGLGAIPDWFMIKNISVGQAWRVYHRSMTLSDPYSKRMVLSETGGDSSSALGLSQDPTSSLIYIDTSTGCTNASGENFICYAWIEKSGFSKFGSYVGNNNSNGTFVYTGFKPSWVMVKRSNGSNDWCIYDNTRDADNAVEDKLQANQSSAESNDLSMDFVSNGFKFRQNGGNFNGSYNYIYMAFGQSLVGTNNIPATAR
tara:strand:+ start:2565 stop:3599 length:1035 start_codon:yes stop_codon:yes gene_type:complete